MRQTYFLTGSGGFFSSRYNEKSPLNALIQESTGFWYTPEGVLETHPGTIVSSPFLVGDVSFPFGDGFGVIGQGINDGVGNAAKYVGNAAIFTTNNNVTIFDPSLSSSNISFPFDNLEKLVPYVAPYKANGVYRTPVKLGVLAQVEPAILTATTETGILDGLYAIRLTYVRNFTGGESLSSPSSNTIQTGPNHKIEITFPEPTNPKYTDDSPLPWDTNDFWIVYATPRNFGNTTVFFKLREVPERSVADELYSGGWTSAPSGGDTEVFLTTDVLTTLFTVDDLSTWLVGKIAELDSGDNVEILSVTGLNSFVVSGSLAASTGTIVGIRKYPLGLTTNGRVILTDWSENDLTDIIPPILNFPPNTTAKFVIPLVDVLVLVGTDGGSGIAPSAQNFFESFPPSHRLALPETPVGVSFKAEDAYAYILCKQSTHELRFTGATDGPAVALRKIASKGTATQKSFVIVEGNIFSFTVDRNIIMIAPGGLVNLELSQPIKEIIRNWNPDNVVMSFDERHNAIVAFHEREFISYHISLGVWSTPTDFELFNNSLTPNPNIPAANSNVLTAISYRGIIHLFTGVGRTVSTTGTTNTTQYNAGSTQFVPQDIGRHIILTLSDGTTFSTEITAVDLFFTTATLAFLPTEFQGQSNVTGTVVLRDSATSSFALDRLEDGTLANNPINAIAEYQWNHFENELLGKTIRMATVVASNPTQPEPPLNPTPVALLFESDGIGGNMSSASVFYPVTFKPDYFVSNPVDVNRGIGRLIRTQVNLGRSVRTLLHGVKVQFTTTKIPGVF